VAKVDAALIAVISRAHANIKAFHAKHLRQSWEESGDDAPFWASGSPRSIAPASMFPAEKRSTPRVFS